MRIQCNTTDLHWIALHWQAGALQHLITLQCMWETLVGLPGRAHLICQIRHERRMIGSTHPLTRSHDYLAECECQDTYTLWTRRGTRRWTRCWTRWWTRWWTFVHMIWIFPQTSPVITVPNGLPMIITPSALCVIYVEDRLVFRKIQFNILGILVFFVQPKTLTQNSETNRRLPGEKSPPS